MSIVIYRAREIVTLDKSCPIATAIAVKDERIFSVGTFEDVVENLSNDSFEVDNRYENLVIVPGFIEAQEYITDTAKRLQVEQIIMSRLDVRVVAAKVNKKRNWFLTEDGITAYRHYFWNVKLLTFEQWGQYLNERSVFRERYMTLLQADSRLALFHLRIDQTLESKRIIQRTQEIAYFALEEVNQLPGGALDKIHAINKLGSTITTCHAALSTSDMALSSVLKEFERFRVEHPLISPSPIQQLSPSGNFTGSGIEVPDSVKTETH